MKYCLLSIITFTLLISCNSRNENERVKPSIRDISELVYASANVVSHNKYNCKPSKSGIIREVLVQKGDHVIEGQSLFIIDASADLKNRLDNANVSLREVKNNLYGNNSKLLTVDLELQRLKEQNHIDSINYERRKRLWSQDIGSKNELEHALLKYQNSSNKIRALRLDYEQLRMSLESNYEKAKNHVSTEQTLLGELIVKSTINGEVFNVFKEVGEYISPQEVFAVIGSTDNYIIEMNIDEVDISKIELGDTAIIALEAYPDKVYTSTLSYISNNKDEPTQTFIVESLFLDSPTKLFHGLAGEVNILIERRENAKVIPSEYIIKGNRVLTEDGEISVRTGVKNLDFVEILDGIDTSVTLLRPDI